jgi:hypothetical protein
MATIIKLAKELAVVVPEMAEDALELEQWVADYLATMLKGKMRGQKAAYTSPLDEQASAIEQVIALLQDVDFGHRTEKELSKLEKASSMLSAAGVKPVDIDMAIRYWGTDPKKTKAFIYGPSGRGTNRGALRDLQDILHNHRTARARRTAVRYWGELPSQILENELSADEISSFIKIPAEFDTPERRQSFLDSFNESLSWNSGDAEFTLEQDLDAMKSAVEAEATTIFEEVTKSSPDHNDERFIEALGDFIPYALYVVVDENDALYNDEFMGFVDLLENYIGEQFPDEKVLGFLDDLFTAAREASSWERVEDEIRAVWEQSRKELQEAIDEEYEEWLEEEGY